MKETPSVGNTEGHFHRNSGKPLQLVLDHMVTLDSNTKKEDMIILIFSVYLMELWIGSVTPEGDSQTWLSEELRDSVTKEEDESDAR